MRIPTYLSPSALSIWKADKEQYYMQYLSENRPPRDPQTQPMAVGSAFDAYIKSYLYKRLIGSGPLAAEFDFDTIFENQVESQNRDQAKGDGREVFEVYENSGALAALLKLLEGAGDLRMEFTTQGDVGGVPLLGKPDLYFKLPASGDEDTGTSSEDTGTSNEDTGSKVAGTSDEDTGSKVAGTAVLLDWKVNGYYGQGRYPCSGYVAEYPGGIMHKKCQPFKITGGPSGATGAAIVVNGAATLEMVDKSWGSQLATYGWLCGEPVGSQFIVGIDQIYRSRGGGLKVACHRCYVGEGFQHTLFAEYRALWEIINSGHIFREMEANESWKRQAMLDAVGDAYDSGDEFGEFLREMR